MDILQAISNPEIFRPFLGSDIRSWEAWFAALRCLYGLPQRAADAELIRQCTGRDPAKLPRDPGFTTALLLTGRRSGKSRMAALIGAFEASISGREYRLAKGERGLVLIVAPTRRQARVVKDYLRAVYACTPTLEQEVVGEKAESLELQNAVTIEVAAGDWRTVRNFTLLAVIVEEAAFLGLDEEAKVRSDAELIRALKPGLATTQGRLIAISSPYARKGWCWGQYDKCYGNDSASTLVWNAPSRTMNPTLPQRIVDEAMAEDPQSARAEYMGEFRDDVAEFLPRSVIESCVKADRKELLPREKVAYCGFVDLSGGRSDDAALAIAHKDGARVVVDFVRRYAPPCNPAAVIEMMARELAKYRIRGVTGDNYAAEFVAAGFRSRGVHYERSELNKSALYMELLPRLCSGEVELLDDLTLINQLAGLERRTRSGGRDVIDHRPGSKDDVANVVAGVVAMTAKAKRVFGAFAPPRRAAVYS